MRGGGISHHHLGGEGIALKGRRAFSAFLPKSVMLRFLMGVPYLCPARTHKVITPAAILSAAYVPSMHDLGRTVQFKVATSHIWTCHCIINKNSKCRLPIHSGVVWEGGRWSHAEAEERERA